MVVAEERSFTKAAAKLGTSQSALSQIVRRLEASLGLPLLARTTRSVAPTEAGERLLETFAPALQDLDARLESLSDLRGKPAGAIRITSVEHASMTILAPVLAKLLPDYPDLKVEIINDYRLDRHRGFERFDAGVRLGEQVDRDMIAVRIGPDFDMVVVGSPSYFKGRTRPRTPHQLTEHACINLRLPTSGGFWPWPFAKDGRELAVRTNGPLAFNTITLESSTWRWPVSAWPFCLEDIAQVRISLQGRLGSRSCRLAVAIVEAIISNTSEPQTTRPRFHPPGRSRCATALDATKGARRPAVGRKRPSRPKKRTSAQTIASGRYEGG